MNYSKQAFILLFSIICIHSFLSAQQISQISKKNFNYQGQTYKYEEMGHIFSQNEQANSLYLEAIQKWKAARTLGTVSLVSIGVGWITVLASLGKSFEGNCRNNSCDTADNALLVGTSLWTIGAGLGVVSLVKKGAKKRYQRKSIDFFNQDYGIKLPKENPVDVQLVIGNGLGIQLKF